MVEEVTVPENYKQLRHIELLELVQRRTDCVSGQEIRIASLSRDALIGMLMPLNKTYVSYSARYYSPRTHPLPKPHSLL